MKSIDYIYISLVMLFAVVGICYMFKMANNIRKKSMDDYVNGKKQRQYKFNK